MRTYLLDHFEQHKERVPRLLAEAKRQRTRRESVQVRAPLLDRFFVFREDRCRCRQFSARSKLRIKRTEFAC